MLGTCSLSVVEFCMKTLLIPVLMYDSGRRRRDLELELDRLTTTGLLGINRIDRIPNARIRELCGVRKGLDERRRTVVLPIGDDGEGWDHRGSLCRRVCWYQWVCRRKDGLILLKKRGLDVRQARRMVAERRKLWGFVRGNT